VQKTNAENNPKKQFKKWVQKTTEKTRVQKINKGKKQPE
jgi:hypothetical protein